MDSTPSKYQVIARKYRPQTFSSVVGQDAIVTTLKNALQFNRLAHAYLFCGGRGTGKTTLARVFAKALNCSRPTENFEPCNTCSSCLDIIAGRSLDVLEIDGASNRGIDDIRQINETIGYAPASGKYKIYIIDEVHMLTKEAFNALLKTLEEPPLNVKFFFATTEPHKVLPTIISRCQRFDLNRIPLEALKKKLAWIAGDLNVACDEDAIAIVANLSEGSLRDAESLFDQIICYADHPITAAKVSASLGILPRSAFFLIDKAFSEQNLSYAFELAGDIFSSGKDLSYFIDNLIEHYRSLLKLKLSAQMVFPTERLKEQYTASVSLYTEEQCLYILDFLIHWQQQIGKTSCKRVSLEMILLHIIRSKHRLTLPALVRRLHDLEQRMSLSHQVPHEASPPSIEPIEAKLQPEKNLEQPGLLKEPLMADLNDPIAESLDKVSIPEKEEAPLQTFTQQETSHSISEPSSSSVKQLESPSLEETLMKRIREKIESTPIPIDQPSSDPLFTENPISEKNSQTASDNPLKQSSLILSKAKWEAIASEDQIQTKPPSQSTEKETPENAAISKPVAPSIEKPAATLNSAKDSTPLPASNAASQSRYDTLMRFAAVELEGILKKEQPNG